MAANRRVLGAICFVGAGCRGPDEGCHRAGPIAQQHVVEVIARFGRQHDRRAPSVALEPAQQRLGGTQAGAGWIVVRQDEDVPGFGRQLHLLHAGGG